MELIAQGPNLDSRWRRQLAGSAFELGRATQSFRVPWDSQISRIHIRIQLCDSGLKIEKVPEAANPVFYNGKASESFILKPGQHFVIGATTFTLTDDKAFASLDAPDPISQKTFSQEFLAKVVYQDADRRIDILNRLPEAISSAGNTDDLLIRMVNMLMAGITPAKSIGIVRTALNPVDDSEIQIVKWDRRGFDEGDFQPSGTLIRQALTSKETVLHIWNQNKRETSQYTFDYENDWAFVCPISSLASQGWGIYVAGTNRGGSSSADRSNEEPDLQGDIKFCELIGSTLKNLLLVREFERQNSSLRAFFSPVVIEAMAGQNPDEVLAPRACDLSVMFCDLKGFSKTSEQMADKLFELLDRVSNSLSIVTGEILNHGGVVGDFQGDSAMGFWGWPIECDNVDDLTTQAVQAAIKIQQLFESNLTQDSDSSDFQIGIGIASGEAVAGKIGSLDQVKVTAFGPVVNLASRLEGMTRWTNSRILVDEETAKRLERSSLPERPVSRRLGKFLPFGMENEVSVYQVFEKGIIAPKHIAAFEVSLQEFEAGNWEQAKTRLESIPSEDRAARFLTMFMTQHDGSPPENWDGVIPMNAK